MVAMPLLSFLLILSLMTCGYMIRTAAMPMPWCAYVLALPLSFQDYPAMTAADLACLFFLRSNTVCIHLHMCMHVQKGAKRHTHTHTKHWWLCARSTAPWLLHRSWLVNANVVHYSFAALMVNQYGSGSSGAGTTGPRLGSLGVLDYFGFGADDAWHYAGMVWAFALAWTLLAWLALVFMRTSRR